MAKLSTPFHPCVQRYVTAQSGITPKCPRPAYRRVGGAWLCREHGRAAKVRGA